jgi:signal peptidase II
MRIFVASIVARIGLPLTLAVLVAATVGCDRVTKHAASALLAGTDGHSFLRDTVRLAYAENTGGFLGLGAGLPVPVRTGVFTVATGLVLVGLAMFAIREQWTGWRAIGVTLFVAGGLSNWVDRVVHGSVVDFMNVGIGGLRTGIFNVADVAIMAGALIFFLAEIRRPPRDAEPAADAGAGGA